MNIIVFVITMIMMLTVITYAKLDSYRSFVGMQAQFTNYMEITERQYINSEAEKLYDSTQVKKGGRGNGGKSERGSGQFSIAPLFPSAAPGSDPARQELTKRLFRQLLGVVYGRAAFFQELEEKRPGFIDEMVNNLPLAMRKATKAKRARNINDLANYIDFGDEELNEAFLRMLKGSQIYNKEKNGRVTIEGYPPLSKFVNYSNSNKPISVYLASREMLQVIFGDMNTVNEIIQMRRQLHRALINEKINENNASRVFYEAFINKKSIDIPSDFLQFTVTKTEPKK